MPRINIEDELWTDSRFMLLSAQVGEEKAIGQLVRFWRIAQQFYKQDKKPIPHQIFKSHKLSPKIISVGLADVSDDGIFAVDSEKHFGWLIGRVKGGETRKGNKNNGVSNANTKRPRDESHMETNAEPMPLTQSPSQSPSQSPTQNTVNTGIQGSELKTFALVPEVDPDDFTKKKKKVLTPEEQAKCKRIWKSYRDAYVARYRTEPTRNGMVNGQVASLMHRLGEEAVQVVEFYLRHNKSFYVEKCHPIGICLADAESLRTQWFRGQAITKGAANQIDKTQTNLDVWDHAFKVVEERKKQGL